MSPRPLFLHQKLITLLDEPGDVRLATTLALAGLSNLFEVSRDM